MARIKSLRFYQKVILIAIFVMIVVFTVLYAITTARVGFSYQDAIFVPSQENGSTVYTGKVQGKSARISVDPDESVTFQYDDKRFGPYTVRENPTAIPKELTEDYDVTGIEIRCGEDVFFRGCMNTFGGHRFLYSEDGSLVSDMVQVVTSGYDVHSSKTLEPNAATILELLDSPELTHKGSWLAWFMGIIICGITVVSILFADELFRLHLSFRIQNVEDAEPTEWEITTRYFSWAILAIGAFAIFIIGLR